MYPVPDFYWDSWEGLEYLNKQRSIPDVEFYNELLQLKEKHDKEYEEWRQNVRKRKNSE